MTSLTNLLLQAQSSELTVRRNAEYNLEQVENNDIDRYLTELSQELKNPNAPDVTRQLAGLLIKNTISGVDHKIDHIKRAKWLNIKEETGICVKEAAIETLSSNVADARGAACQVISKLCRIELPLGKMHDIFYRLYKLASSKDEAAKKGALMSFGYICEDLMIVYEEMPLYPDCPTEEHCNFMLNALAEGMNNDDITIRLIAVKALYHALPFAFKNIQRETERNYLFRRIFDNLRNVDLRVQQSSWDCVLQLVSNYYEYMNSCMVEIAGLSLQTIKQGNTMTSLAAMEFWNNLCDEEISIIKGESDRQLMDYIQQAQSVLIPVLFDCMVNQLEDDLEMGNWTLAMAAGTCLGLCAEILKDDILETTLHFVNSNFGNSDWRFREAALFVYGSVMEGPSSEKLKPLVAESFPLLCRTLVDDNVAVRDTTAWTIGRIAQFHFPCIYQQLGTPDRQSGLINMLLERLNDQPRVARQICFSLHAIATQAFKYTSMTEANVLVHWFKPLIKVLYNTASRPDADECNLSSAAYAALSFLLTTMEGGDKPILAYDLLLATTASLEESFKDIQNDATYKKHADLCGCLESCIRATSTESIIPKGEYIFSVFWRVIFGGVNYNENATETEIFTYELTPASEDAMLGISALIFNMKHNFERYAASLCKIIHYGLKNRLDESFCELSVEILGDLSRALGKKFAPYAKPMLEDLYVLLKDTTAKPSLKPRAMNTLGDIALNIGGAFEEYLCIFLDILKQATQTRVEQGPIESEDWLEFIHKLRDGVLFAYEGIMFGLKDDNKVHTIKYHVVVILDFIQLIIEDYSKGISNNLIKSMEVLVDLVCIFPEISSHIKQRNDFWRRINELNNSDNDIIKKQSTILQRIVSGQTIQVA